LPPGPVGATPVRVVAVSPPDIMFRAFDTGAALADSELNIKWTKMADSAEQSLHRRGRE